MGTDAWFSSPKMFLAAAKLLGYTHARLDYDPDTEELWGSITQKGQVKHVQIPLGQTFTIEQICERIFSTAPAGASPP